MAPLTGEPLVMGGGGVQRSGLRKVPVAASTLHNVVYHL